jgi:hypothetical protein
VFFQQANGQFTQRDLVKNNPAQSIQIQRWRLAACLMPMAMANLDLYAASGGYETPANSPEYQDRLYLNDGKGNFTLATDALPTNFTSKLCVRACDYNKDGKLDLFISGRVEPWKYPQPVSSIILLRNDSRDGHMPNLPM